MTTFIYLGHRIEIDLPDPFEDNTIRISIYRKEGYDPETYNPDLTHYQFSAEDPDPNNWIVEAINSAIAQLSNWDVRFHHQPVAIQEINDEDLPF